jgi:large subunit ribosomal protein L17
MQHLKNGRKFKRDRKQRKAFFKNILGSLILHEKIKTTEAKAKEVKILIDKIINKAKLAKVEAKKVNVIRELGKKVPETAVRKLIGDFIDRFSKRKSGYARVTKLAPRKSDSAKMAMVEFVD